MSRYRAIFQSAVNEALAGATVLTGNRRAARQLLAACESQLRLERKAWETPRVLTWDAWLERAWQESLVRGLTGLTLLAPAQTRAVWQQIVSASRSGAALGNKAGVVQTAWQAWQTLHEYGIELSAAPFQVSAETRSFYEWALRYRELCAANSWTDSACLPDQLRQMLAKSTGLATKIVLYGFDELTPQQSLLQSALQRAGAELVKLVPGENWTVPEHARCVNASDAADELVLAAKWAREKLEVDPATRIAIVVPRLRDLRAQAGHIFTTILHPEALLIGNAGAPQAFDISLGHSLAEYPVVAAALTAVRLAVEAVPTHDLTMLIRSPYIGSSQAEASPRARFDVYLRGISGPQITLPRVIEALASDEAPRCTALKWHLNRFASIAEKLQQPLRPSQWTDRVAEVLEALGWPGTGERGRVLNSAEYQTVQAWSETLAEFARLDLIVPSLHAVEMCDQITAFAQGRTFKPESAGAPVQILGPLEAAGSVFDHLWISGLSDDVWPARGNSNPFLPLALQRSAGVPHSLPPQDYAYARRITARMAQSAEEVMFSWPKREEDTLLRPSPLLAGIAKAQTVPADSSAHDWATLQRRVSAETYNGESAPPLEGLAARGGTRIFELQSNCPFHAFAELRLGARQLDEPQPGLRARDRGKVIETALQLVWTQLRDHFTLTQTSEGELERIVGESVENAMAEMPVPHEPWEERYQALERSRLVALVNEWLRVERRREPFEVLEHQREVNVTAGGITVRGRIDRLDRAQDGGLVVLDYKSGNATYGPGQWNGDRPERPQLPLYVITQTQPVAGVAFALLRTGGCEFKGLAARKEILGKTHDRSKQCLNGSTFEQYIAEWRPTLDRIGESFRAGVAAPDPLPDRVCEYCHLPAVCRRAELETDDPCQHGEVDEEE